ncbi:class IV adenylate cyclase [Halorarum salinum]|uniref:Class IV adenylate cyclase n=1 Tax=Halorarum salinum TaxID=2743089 RepID=A0A7D5QKV6_9EURY|nr:class IV adenylate cyclase [Halobaculum salinum]QLG62405.1 class IV adenylate cyclase [Halobaculum salinum]
MYEVELKVRADHDAVRKRLASLDAVRRGHVRQTDDYYDAPHRSFTETDEALRVRRERTVGDENGDAASDADEDGTGAHDAVTVLTYKGPLVEEESKTREERETAVADSDAVEGILVGLGFETAATVEKEREAYEVDGYAVTLDRVAGLGEFVEVECEADADEVPAAREGAVALLRELGLDPDDHIRTSYLGLLLAESDAQQ